MRIINSFCSFQKKNNKINNNKGINLTKRLNIKNSSKEFIFLNIISILLLNIYNISCESYITLKINKPGRKKIIYNGDINEGSSRRKNFPAQRPNSMIINTYTVNPQTEYYDFEGEENNIKLFYDDNKNSFECLFYGCTDINKVDLSNLKTSYVENMTSMFEGCTSLTSINLLNIDTSKVTLMSYMFYNCNSLKSLDLSSFNTENLIKMRSMFGSCTSLTYIDLTKFSRPRLVDIALAFELCSNLTSINVSSFDTSNIIYMDQIFSKCYSLKSIDVSNFKTSKVEWMSRMFYSCYLITSLDLSNFDISKVGRFQSMFQYCISLTSLNLSNFKTEKGMYMTEMFSNCYNLTYLNIDNFNTFTVQKMNRMFFDCSKLTYINLSSFNTANNVEFQYMFNGCSSLLSLDITHFVTTKAENTGYMFYGCSSLTELNIKTFVVSKVKSMEQMFGNCYKLFSLDLSNFITSSATNMNGMFQGCYSLESLDISKFVTSKVTDMRNMFNGCSSLLSLNLNNFVTALVTKMDKMFYGCYKLQYLDISRFITTKVNSMAEMFANCSTLNSLELSHFDFSSVANIEYMFSNCSNLQYINLKNLIINNGIKYTSLIDNNLINPVICIDDKPSLYKIIALYKCQNLNYSSWGEYMEQIEYDENIFIEGCLLSKVSQKCYQICSNYFYFDEDNRKYLCTENLECPALYDKLIDGKNECIKSCSSTKVNIYELRKGLDKKCLINCPMNYRLVTQIPNFCIQECSKENPFLLFEAYDCTSNCTIKQRQNKVCIRDFISKVEDNEEILDSIIKQTKNELLNNFNESVVNGEPILDGGMNITITKTKKENISEDDINLGDCEDRLKKNYGILEEESLYILRANVEQLGLRVPSLQYEILYPLNGSKNLVKLDLQVCSDLRMNRVISINLTGNIDMYNKSSPYYNDICYITDSEYGTDISLVDRRENYINNNMGICEDGCDFVSYNNETKKAVCSCKIKNEIESIKKIQLDKASLLKSFIDINNIANIQMLKCYKIVFRKNNIIKNIGCYIYVFFILLNLFSLIYFLIKDFKKLIRNIHKIKLNIIYKNDDKNKKKSNKINHPHNIYKIKKIDESLSHLKSSERNFDNIKSIKNDKYAIKKKKLNEIHSPPKINFNFISKKNVKIVNYKEKIKNKNKSHDKKEKKKLHLNYNEINHLTFDEALNKDKRTFCKYYLSLLKTHHLIIYIFYSKDFNSKIIKFSMFIFNLASGIAINSLFFNDFTMHKIYVDHGSFDFLYQLPQIIYSTIISEVFDFLINLLGLSEDNVLKIKEDKILETHKHKKIKNLIRVLRIKFILYFIVDFILLFSFWYYVTCFCGIYRNTQIHLFKDSLFSFITSLISPFGFYFIPSIFRKCALKEKNKILFKFSKILQTI